jgi:hypothetical protein
METVTVSQRVDAPPSAVEDAIDRWGAFVRAAGFDEVAVHGDRIRVANSVGVKDIELELAVVDREDAYLAYEQREGIFETMWTTYSLTPRADGDATSVQAVTAFSLAIPLVGEVLDSTIVRHQRRRELDAQLDWLVDTAT